MVNGRPPHCKNICSLETLYVSGARRFKNCFRWLQCQLTALAFFFPGLVHLKVRSELVRCSTTGLDKPPLARQRKPQITRYFTTQMLHYYKLNLDSEDYK